MQNVTWRRLQDLPFGAAAFASKGCRSLPVAIGGDIDGGVFQWKANAGRRSEGHDLCNGKMVSVDNGINHGSKWLNNVLLSNNILQCTDTMKGRSVPPSFVYYL